MAELKDLSVEAFADVTASDAPAPGGGSVAAVAGSLAAALAEMVANLTIGKKGYEEQEAEMKRLAAEGALIRETLIADIRRDSDSFNAFMDAMAMPKDTEEQQAARRSKMQECLKAAAEVPLSAAETACKIFPIAEAVVKSGNKNAVTDGLVSALLARSAVLGALLNVRINLASIRDEAFVAAMRARVTELERTAQESEKKVLQLSDLTSDIQF